MTTETTAMLGTIGGVPQDPVACDGGFVVGITVALTAEPDQGRGNEYIIAKVVMVCAPIAQRDEAFVTGPTTDQLVAVGNNQKPGDQTASCAPGAALVGLDVHQVTAGGLFNSMSIECAQLTPSGPRATTDTVVVPNDGTTPADAHASCGDGTVVTGMQGWSGNEVDQLKLSCAEPACG